MSASERIGPYWIERRLGSGGMGAVFQARDPATGTSYAVKVLAPGADAELRMRFRREGEAHAKVDGHPNVIRIHAAGQDGERAYLAMDLVDGGDLEERLRRGPLPFEEAARITRDLARGLAHLHAHGVLHRDLKPANVLLTVDGTPKLADFGLARLAGSASLTESGSILGTPSYMAPEQVMSEVETAATDVYGLGAVLYHLITGSPPFHGPSPLAVLTRVAGGGAPAPSVLRPDCPATLEAICRRAMAVKPHRRFSSAARLAEALDAYLRGEAPPELRRAPLILALIGVAVAALALAATLPTDSDATDRRAPRVAASDPASPGTKPPSVTPTAASDGRGDPVPGNEAWDLIGLLRTRDKPEQDVEALNELLERLDGRRAPWASTAHLIRGKKLTDLADAGALKDTRSSVDTKTLLRARADFDRAFELDPRQVDALVERARVHTKLDQPALAIRDVDLRLYVEPRPTDEVAHDLFVRRGSSWWRLAERFADPSASRGLKPAERELFERARREHLERAWADLERALERRDGVSLRYGRIRVATSWGRWSLAHRELVRLKGLLEKRGKLDSHHGVFLYLNWAGTRLELGDVWGASEDVRKAEELGARHDQVAKLVWKIGAGREHSKHPRARADLDPVTALESATRGSLPPEALVAGLTRAMTRYNTTAGILCQRARALLELGRQQDASDDLAWARALEPGYPGLKAVDEMLRPKRKD